MEDMLTIKDYLCGVSPLINDDALHYILVRRRIAGCTPLSELSQRDLDLAEGTAYYWLTNLSIGGGTTKEADGDWSHSEGGWQVSKENIAEWKRKCKMLFGKWGEECPVSSGVRLVNLC